MEQLITNAGEDVEKRETSPIAGRLQTCSDVMEIRSNIAAFWQIYICFLIILHPTGSPEHELNKDNTSRHASG